jgi:hypothetical protein
MVELTLERLLTSPRAWNLEEATDVQRAICRTGDGLPLGELASCAEVRTAFRNVDDLPIGQRPREMHIVGPVRAGKSKLMAAWVFRASQSVNVDKANTGDIVRISLVALKLSTNAVWTHLLETVMAQPLLRQFVIGDPTDEMLVLRHPTGRPIEVMRIPLDRWGGSIVSVYSAGVFVDEEPRMIGAADGVKNWDHMHSASLARMLDEAQFVGAGAPHAPFGPLYSVVQEFWGKPSADMVVVRATGPMMNPSWWTAKRQADLQRTNPHAYRTDCLGEFDVAEDGLVSPLAVSRNRRAQPLELPPRRGAMYVAHTDLSDVEAGNPATLTILEVVPVMENGTAGCKFRTALAREWRNTGIASCLEEMAKLCRAYRCRTAGADQFAGGANTALAARYGLTLQVSPSTGTSNLETFTNFATLLHTDRIELPPHDVLCSDILSVRKRTTQTGYQIILPKTADGRHADYAPAIAGAVARGRHPSKYDPDYFHVAGARSDRSDPTEQRWHGRAGESLADLSSDERFAKFYNDEGGGR